jgi:hypothetical protein
MLLFLSLARMVFSCPARRSNTTAVFPSSPLWISLPPRRRLGENRKPTSHHLTYRMGCTTSTETKGALSSPTSPKPHKATRKRKDDSRGGHDPQRRKKGRARSQRKEDSGNLPLGSETSELLSTSPTTQPPRRKKQTGRAAPSKGSKSTAGFHASETHESPSFKPCTSTESGNLQDLMLTLKASSAQPRRPAELAEDGGMFPLPSFPPVADQVKPHVTLAGPDTPVLNQPLGQPELLLPSAQIESDLAWIHDSSDSQSEKNRDSGSAKARRRSTSMHQLSTSSFGRIAYPPGAVAEQPRVSMENALLTSDWRGRPGGTAEKNLPTPAARDRSSGSSLDRLHRASRAAATSSSSAFSDSRGDSSVGLFFQAEAERRSSNQGYEKLEPIDPQWWKTTYQQRLQPQANPFLPPPQSLPVQPQPTDVAPPRPRPATLHNVPDTSVATNRAAQVSQGEGQEALSTPSHPQSPAEINKVATWLEELKTKREDCQ